MPASGAPAATYATSNIIGVDVTAVYGVPGSSASYSTLSYPETSLPPHAPGTMVLAGSDQEYVFCQISSVGSVNQYDWVAFVASAASVFVVAQLSSVNSATATRVGLVQTQVGTTGGIPASVSSTYTQWAWVATRGSNLNANLYAGSIAAGQGYSTWNVSSIAGVLTNMSTGSTQVVGIYNLSSIGSTASTETTGVAVAITWPRMTTF